MFPPLPTMALRPRPLLRNGLIMLLCAPGLAVQAQPAAEAAANWPNRPVRVVVAFPPAGPADILARGLGDVLQRQVKQPFVVDNKPGAGGNIGADSVAKAPGDGYNLLIGVDTTFTVNPFIYKSMPFKNSDLRPVMMIASQGMMVAVNPATGIKSLEQLIERGKKQPLNFSSAGYGTPGHLASAILTHATGVKINLVPYKGNAPASTAVLAGEVDGGVLGATALLPHLKVGKVTALAVTSRQRDPLAPDAPTVGELGHKALEQEILFVAWVPRSTPEPLFQKIQGALEEAMKDPELQARMRNNDLLYEGLTGEAAARRVQALADRYKTVIQATGMKME